MVGPFPSELVLLEMFSNCMPDRHKLDSQPLLVGVRKVMLRLPCRMVERSNLLNLMKLVVKGLIESSMRLGRTLSDDHTPLQQFFITMEQTLKHRLRSECRIQYACPVFNGM